MLITIYSKAFRNSSDCVCPTGKGKDHDHWQHTATYVNTLQHTATYWNTLQHTAQIVRVHRARVKIIGNTLQHTATYCNILQHALHYTATHCNIYAPLAHRARITIIGNTFQNTATQCNTLQHTATAAHHLPNLQNHDHWMCIHKKYVFLCIHKNIYVFCIEVRFYTQIFRCKTRVQKYHKSGFF